MILYAYNFIDWELWEKGRYHFITAIDHGKEYPYISIGSPIYFKDQKFEITCITIDDFANKPSELPIFHENDIDGSEVEVHAIAQITLDLKKWIL